jgi:hypothetical protein
VPIFKFAPKFRAFAILTALLRASERAEKGNELILSLLLIFGFTEQK